MLVVAMLEGLAAVPLEEADMTMEIMKLVVQVEVVVVDKVMKIHLVITQSTEDLI
jgi:hypothetical protein